ncbi:nucleotide-diphospho-sugar transferase [Chytridium lagenaria]|nr:nucleotide-diphospho-sugar transferase [Chytridium lagenaria]
MSWVVDPQVALSISALSRELKGVILAGRGTRMFPLTEGENLPKAFLPIANKPMIYYQLQWLEDAKINDILVICLDTSYKKLHHYVHNVYEKSNEATKIDVVKVKSDDGLGSADVLRQHSNRIKTDFILLSCDIITNFPPHRLIDVYRMQSPTVTALFYESLKAEEASSWKKDDDALQEFVGIDHRTCQLVMTTPLDELDDEELPIRIPLLEAFPIVKVHTKLRDAHMYIFKHWILDLIAAKPKISNIRRDLIPVLLKAQYSGKFMKKEGIDKLLPLDQDTFLPARDLSSTGGGFVGSDTTPKIVCTAIVPGPTSGYIFRANTQWAYMEGNKQMTKQLTEGLVASSAEISSRAQVGPDSMVGEGTKIGERSSVKKSVIGHHCVIGKNVKIAGSIIMDHCIVEDNVKLDGSILCNTSKIHEAAQLKDCMVGASFVVEKEGERFPIGCLLT